MKKGKLLTRGIAATMALAIAVGGVTFVNNKKVNADEIVQNVYTEDTEADKLFDAQIKANLDGNKTLSREIDKKLEDLGYEDCVKEIGCATINDEPVLTASVEETGGPNMAKSKDISTKKKTYTKKYGGKNYKITEYVHTPKYSSGPLFQAGAVAKKNYNTSGKKAGAISVVSTTSSAIAAKTCEQVSIAMTLYDIAKSASEACSKTTKVKNITANYTWSTMETLKEIYVNGTIAAGYNKVSVITTVVIPTIKYSNGKSNHKHISKEYKGSYKSKGYGNVENAIKKYKKGEVYSSTIVEDVTIRSVNKKKIEKVSLYGRFYPPTPGLTQF